MARRGRLPSRAAHSFAQATGRNSTVDPSHTAHIFERRYPHPLSLLDHLSNCHSLPLDVLTPALFRDISASLQGDEWRALARRLGMTRMRIEAIDHDHHDEASYHMLLAWFKRAPRSADKVAMLITALNSTNHRDLAQELQIMHDEKRDAQKPSSKEGRTTSTAPAALIGSIVVAEQLKSFRAPFNRICQREECVRMWKQLARDLKLTNDDIEHIENKYASKEEQCQRSLEQWAANDAHADIPSLAFAIRKLGLKSLART